MPVDYGTYKSCLLCSTSHRIVLHGTQRIMPYRVHRAWYRLELAPNKNASTFLKFISPFHSSKIKGLHKAHCFRAKYNRISQSFHTILTFTVISIAFVNYKAGNLCSCPLIIASTKVACYVPLSIGLCCSVFYRMQIMVNGSLL